jgi:DNA-binding transcriptional ArsR family regulator
MDKLLLNPIRLKIISTLLGVSSCDFNHLQKVTESSKGNLSVQLKKLEVSKYILITKSFKNNYPNTSCSITNLGSKRFEDFFKSLMSLRK